MPIVLNLALIKKNTQAEGPGSRYAVWFQGCPIKCVGCCNPEMQLFEQKKLWTVEKLIGNILNTKDIEGVTLLGGEPFYQSRGLAELCIEIRKHSKLSILIFTGYNFEFLNNHKSKYIQTILNNCDVIISEPFIQELYSENIPYIGSTNQVVHLMTDFYKDWEERVKEHKNTLELSFANNNKIIYNGFPFQELTEFIEKF